MIGSQYFSKTMGANDQPLDRNLLDWDNDSESSGEEEDYNEYEHRETFTYDDGLQYKGQWKDTMRHGYGV